MELGVRQYRNSHFPSQDKQIISIIHHTEIIFALDALRRHYEKATHKHAQCRIKIIILFYLSDEFSNDVCVCKHVIKNFVFFCTKYSQSKRRWSKCAVVREAKRIWKHTHTHNALYEKKKYRKSPYKHLLNDIESITHTHTSHTHIHMQCIFCICALLQMPYHRMVTIKS